MKRLFVALLMAGAAGAAVRGVVMNRTTDKPAAGIAVTLMSMSAAGMQPVETVTTDAQGRFVFTKAPEAVHYLIEAQLDGVTYNRMVAPGEAVGEVELAVYHATDRPEPRPEQRIVFLEPAADALRVNETWLYRNDGKRTLYAPGAATLRFFVPEAAGNEVTVMVTAPGGMPVPRRAEREPRGGLYRLAFPVKPGETRFDVSYTLPAASGFTARMPYPQTPTRLVVPAGVTLRGEGVEAVGPDPSGRAMIYEIRGRREFAVEIEGRGVLAELSEEAGPSLEQIPPAIYDRLAWILAPAAAALFLGFWLLYRTSPATKSPARSPRR
jgi:hypothetical protein